MEKCPFLKEGIFGAKCLSKDMSVKDTEKCKDVKICKSCINYDPTRVRIGLLGGVHIKK